MDEEPRGGAGSGICGGPLAGARPVHSCGDALGFAPSAAGGDRIPAAGRARVAGSCVLLGLSWGDLQVFTVLPR